MTSIIKRSSLSLVATAMALAAAALAPGAASADSFAASHGNPLAPADASCLFMSFGSLTNTCSRTVPVELALPVRSSGNKCVNVYYPSGALVTSRAFSLSSNLTGFFSGTPVYYSTYARICGVPISTDWTLNVTFDLKPGQRVHSVSWDA